MTEDMSWDSWRTEVSSVPTRLSIRRSPESSPQLWNFSFVRREAWTEELLQPGVEVIPAKPFRSGVCVPLIGVAAIAREAVAPQRRINLNDCGFARRHLPTVEQPEMDSIPACTCIKRSQGMPACVDLATEPPIVREFLREGKARGLYPPTSRAARKGVQRASEQIALRVQYLPSGQSWRRSQPSQPKRSSGCGAGGCRCRRLKEGGESPQRFTAKRRREAPLYHSVYDPPLRVALEVGLEGG